MINHAWGKDHIVNNTCTNGLVNYLVVFQSLTLSIPDERHFYLQMILHLGKKVGLDYGLIGRSPD